MVDRSDHGEQSSLRLILRAFKHRNYRLYFGGQGISLIGTWMQRIAMSWMVYRLTNSAFLLGLVGFVGTLPTFALAPFAGVLADRWNRRRLLILVQSLAALQALILAVLVLADLVTVSEVVALAVFLGVVEAFDMPIRQSFMVEMVDKKDLGNAIALNSSMVNSARLLGPSLAGILIAAAGEGICFLLNALSYLAVIGSLFAMRTQARATQEARGAVLKDLKDGFAYAYQSLPIRSVLLLLAVVGLVGMPYSTLMPIFARDILHGGPHTMGFLMASTGVGALTGAVWLASRKSVVGLGRWIAGAAAVFGLGLIAFALSRLFWLSLTMLFVTGLGMVLQMASSNTILQTIVDEDKRGRVMSFHTIALRGMAPFGSLLAGLAASAWGAPMALILGGSLTALASLLFAANLPAFCAEVRPIYERLGIIPAADMTA